jgi:hypothetical protein
MSKLSWAATVRLVHERADYICEYCQTAQRIIGQAMHVEHIDPKGGNDPDNLCLSCPTCNMSKALATSAADPETGGVMPLFNPRLQVWAEHFMWIGNGTMLRGLTPIGRATVARLKMNRDRLVDARQIWVAVGEHPP